MKRCLIALMVFSWVPVMGSVGAAPAVTLEQCFGATPTILGTPSDDRLQGTPGDDVIAGFGGEDVLVGGAGHDILCGASGADLLRGGSGSDGIVAGRGRDRADGGRGPDLVTEFTESTSGMLIFRAEMQDGRRDDLDGGPGADLLQPEGGEDVVTGGPGRDLVWMVLVWDPVLVDLQEGFASSSNGGVDELRSVEGAVGGMYADTLLGNETTNWLWGLRGPDLVDARGGRDLLWSSVDGSRLVAGNDQAADTVAVALTEPMRIDLAAGTIGSMEWDHGHPHDVLVGIENAVGTDQADVIMGSALENALFGRAGDDRILGGAGDDLLRGDGSVEVPMSTDWKSGGGADSLDGGPGTDRLDGGPKQDACVNGESVTSCESEEVRADRSSQQQEGYATTWFGPGRAPWWWSRVGELTLHADERV